MNDQPEILTAKEAADLLRVPIEKLWSLSAAGKVPCWKVGGSWRYSRQALLHRVSQEPERRRRRPSASPTVRRDAADPASAFVPPKQNRYAGQF